MSQLIASNSPKANNPNNLSKSQAHQPTNSTKPCSFVFTKKGCNNGESCKFSHDRDLVLTSRGLTKCETLNCDRYSNFQYCSKCFAAIRQAREQASFYNCETEQCPNRIQSGRWCDPCYQAWLAEQPRDPCQGCNCKELALPGKKLCKACAYIERCYVVRR